MHQDDKKELAEGRYPTWFIEILRDVYAMRQAQSKYFNHKSVANIAVAKKREALVDEWIRRARGNGLLPPMPGQQVEIKAAYPEFMRQIMFDVHLCRVAQTKYFTHQSSLNLNSAISQEEVVDGWIRQAIQKGIFSAVEETVTQQNLF
jgi:hypothetical protein